MERSLESLLSWWDVSGVDTPVLPKNTPRRLPTKKTSVSKTIDPTKPVPTAKQAARQAPPPAPTIAASELVKKVTSLQQLQLVIADYNAGEISDHARQSVFARGNPNADIMIIGEAPDRDEDIEGKPFVGRTGQLFDRVLASIGLSEDNLYLTHVINWRPPGNRNPTADEIAACLPFIHKHIELVAPKIVVLVGGVSFSALTGQSGIMKNRGQWTTVKLNNGSEIPALPVFHPAFLLRQPDLKKETWLDMLSLRNKAAELAITLP